MTATAATPATRHHPLLVPVVLTGIVLSAIDFFIVNVAIPSVQADLGADDAALQLLVAGYALTYGVGLITGGRLGDLLGRRQMFLLGLALFVAASAACGLAPDAGVLVGARLVQGGAAALLTPQVLAILTTELAGEARARAISRYAVIMGVSAVLGQVVGGLLIKADVAGLGWRVCFLVNVPIGLVALALAAVVVPESRAPRGSRLDLPGVLLLTAGLSAVVLPLVLGREQDWPRWTVVSLAAAAPLLAAFAAWEHRLGSRGGAPLVDLTLFRRRAFTAGLLGQLVFFTGQASYFLVFALFVQQGHGLSPFGSGLLFSAVGGGYLVGSLTARRVAHRLGPQVIAAGAVIRMCGVLLQILVVARIGVTGSVGWLVPALLVDGIGMGLAVAPLVGTVLSRVDPRHAGAASGVLNTAMQIGNALGVALIGLVFFHVLAGSDQPDAAADAFRTSLLFNLGVSLTLAATVQLLPRRGGPATAR